MKNICSLINALEPSSRVAVITFVGSFCPVTRAHLICVEEARKIIIGEPSEYFWPLGQEQMRKIQKYALVVAVISVNGDRYVNSKLKKVGEVAISSENRRMLINLAIEDVDWICSHDRAWGAVNELKRCYPQIDFTHFELDGADVALKNEVWNDASQQHIRIAMGRAPETDELDSTEEILKLIQNGHIDISNGHFLVGPILPNISSSRVRRALRIKDLDSLRSMLHPRVLEWILEAGPYRDAEQMFVQPSARHSDS